MLNVSNFGQKRLLTVPVKLSETEKKVFTKIAKSEDRPLGYTIRELALRGLIDFEKDRHMRVNEFELKESIKQLLNESEDLIKVNENLIPDIKIKKLHKL